MHLSRILISIFLCFWILLLFPQPVKAADKKFQVTYDITYKVQENASTDVVENIHIKNLTTESLAKEFVIKLKKIKVSDVQAFDQSGSLEINQFAIDGGTEIRIQFGKLAPGIDKTMHWTLTYKADGLAKKIGRLWKVSLPQFPKTSNSDDVTIGLYVPPSFGAPLLAKPIPSTKDNIWSGAQAAGPIVAIYGPRDQTPYQAYDFNLSYKLTNDSVVDQVMDIALPPNTSYQKVFITSLDPKPKSINLDQDGNTIASFNVSPKSSLGIKSIGNIAVFAKPVEVPIESKNSQIYLDSQPFWETTSNEVKKVTSDIFSPKDIYDFTISHLSYDPNKPTKNPNRLGAQKALETRLSAICTEFTDVFVALARASGIKAREIDGFAYTEDQKTFPVLNQNDVLHAWPEYLDETNSEKMVWRMVDPTWGKTSGGMDYFQTFDFDHVALAIRGTSSTSPNPAGFYKENHKLKHFIKDEQPKKDVFIKPVNIDLPVTEEAKLNFLAPNQIVGLEGLPIKAALSLENSGNTTSMAQKMTIGRQSISVPPVPPFGKHKLELDLTGTNNGVQTLVYSLNGEEKTQSVKIIPFGTLSWFLHLPGYFLNV